MENNLAKRVVTCLIERGLRLAVAESCTGGQLAASFTAIPGVSACFMGGVVAYHNRVKETLLSVPTHVINTYGAVSEPVAIAMAKGAAQAMHADVAVSTTGIAGPGGGMPDKPVGTVWFGWQFGELTGAKKCLFSGTRDQIQRQAVIEAHKILLEIVV